MKSVRVQGLVEASALPMSSKDQRCFLRCFDSCVVQSSLHNARSTARMAFAASCSPPVVEYEAPYLCTGRLQSRPPATRTRSFAHRYSRTTIGASPVLLCVWALRLASRRAASLLPSPRCFFRVFDELLFCELDAEFVPQVALPPSPSAASRKDGPVAWSLFRAAVAASRSPLLPCGVFCDLLFRVLEFRCTAFRANSLASTASSLFCFRSSCASLVSLPCLSSCACCIFRVTMLLASFFARIGRLPLPTLPFVLFRGIYISFFCAGFGLERVAVLCSVCPCSTRWFLSSLFRCDVSSFPSPLSSVEGRAPSLFASAVSSLCLSLATKLWSFSSVLFASSV